MKRKMKKTILNYLEECDNKSKRKVIFVIGGRSAGKTYFIKNELLPLLCFATDLEINLIEKGGTKLKEFFEILQIEYQCSYQVSVFSIQNGRFVKGKEYEDFLKIDVKKYYNKVKEKREWESKTLCPNCNKPINIIVN